jgi:uncharacterized protein (TIGR00369 family)
MSAAQQFQDAGVGKLPGVLGLEIMEATPEHFAGRFTIAEKHMAPNGFLHAASVFALADTLCGYATVANMPAGGAGFTTIESKSNFLGTARDGGVTAIATPVHRGRTTQVWDAIVTRESDEATIAMFRCTQMILYPKA